MFVVVVDDNDDDDGDYDNVGQSNFFFFAHLHDIVFFGWFLSSLSSINWLSIINVMTLPMIFFLSSFVSHHSIGL